MYVRMLLWLVYLGSTVVNAYLLVDIAGPLAAVLVGEVEGVAGELDTASSLTLGKESVLGACMCKRSN